MRNTLTVKCLDNCHLQLHGNIKMMNAADTPAETLSGVAVASLAVISGAVKGGRQQQHAGCLCAVLADNHMLWLALCRERMCLTSVHRQVSTMHSRSLVSRNVVSRRFNHPGNRWGGS